MEQYHDVTLDLKSAAAPCKIFGRCYRNNDGLVMLWPGNAIEFTAELGGELVLRYKAEENGYLQVFVDGAPDNRARLTASGEMTELPLADIRPGQHTVRIVRENDLDPEGAVTVWQALCFRGIESSVKATEKKPLFIEYVGDSITAGKGVLSGDRYRRDDPNHSVTHAYSYLSAELLGADYCITARGGCGLIRRSAACPKTMGNMYDYVNPLSTKDDLVPYDFARKPDVIVYAIGGNDHVEGEEFDAAQKAMYALLRERNGKDVKIVVPYGMMSERHLKDYPRLAEECGAYSLRVPQNNDGGSFHENGTGHPGVEGQKRTAELLAAFLKTIL